MRLKLLQKLFLLGLLLLSISFSFAQKSTNKSKGYQKLSSKSLTPKEKLIKAYDNLAKARKFNKTEKTISNGDTLERKFEFVHPNSYYLKAVNKKANKETNLEYILIGKNFFEKEDGEWFERGGGIFRDVGINTLYEHRNLNPFKPDKTGFIETISFKAKGLENEIINGEKIEVIEYELINTFLPTQGKVWIKNNLPIKHSYETLPDCLNEVKGETVFEYDEKIIITKPSVKQK